MNFTTGSQLLEICEKEQKTISEIMIEREQALFEESDIFARMYRCYEIMEEASHQALVEEKKSMGGLIGGEAKRLTTFRMEQKHLCGDLMSKAIAYAMGVMEVNSSMGLIVAAPTAGSSGVLPGILVALKEEHQVPIDQILHGLFNAGAIGYLISRNATVAGAKGGCQAEVGTASAMAASALTEIKGGTPRQCLDAASTSLMNILGMVCDPIGGLVEAPCQKRNALGVSNAMISAEMSLSGIKSIIPFDEVVDAMYRVGKAMPEELRETALGGVAATKTACDLCSQVKC